VTHYLEYNYLLTNYRIPHRQSSKRKQHKEVLSNFRKQEENKEAAV